VVISASVLLPDRRLLVAPVEMYVIVAPNKAVLIKQHLVACAEMNVDVIVVQEKFQDAPVREQMHVPVGRIANVRRLDRGQLHVLVDRYANVHVNVETFATVLPVNHVAASKVKSSTL